MSFARYGSYKNSGVEWLGEVPSHWHTQSLKTVASWNDEILSDVTSLEDEIEYLEISGVNEVEGIKETAVMSFADAPSRARRRVRAGDILISTVRTYLRAIAPVTETSSHLIVSTGFAVVRPIGADGRYLSYAARSEPFIAEVISRSVGVSYPAINASDLVRICIALPPEDEQRAIADFLDRETAKIDALVEAQRRLIPLLKEKRQAVISRAVTKGLDLSAPMKPSGVGWLGDVPAHWEVRKFRDMLRETPRYGVLVPDFDLDGVPMLRINDMTTGRPVDRGGLVTISPGLSNQYDRTILEPGDVAITVVGTIGETLIADEALSGVNLSRAVARLQMAAGCSAELATWLFKSSAFRVFVDLTCVGTAQRVLNMDDLSAIRFAFPSSVEQAQIVSSLTVEVGRLEALVTSAEHAVNLLQERRAALISAAVTGKIDVRGWTAEQVRNALAAEIVHLHARDRTFGRVQNQKLIYLAQTHAGVSEIGGRFERKAAGPHDRALMSSIEHALKAEGVMQVSQPEGDDTRVIYTLARGAHPTRDRLQAMLGEERLAKLDHVLKVLASEDTRGVEAVATLYAVWNDALLDGETPDDDRLVRGFLKEWHPEKSEKFTAADVRNRIGFLRRNNLVPTGQGARTQAGALI